MRKVLGQDGATLAQIDAAGRITLGLESGAPIGLVRSNGEVFADEAGGRLIARVTGSGEVSDERYERLGSVDSVGTVRDKTGRVAGKVGEAVDAAVLLLLLERRLPAENLPPQPAPGSATLMDEALELVKEETRYPGIKRSYKPLTDEEVYGKVRSPS